MQYRFLYAEHVYFLETLGDSKFICHFLVVFRNNTGIMYTTKGTFEIFCKKFNPNFP